MPYSCVIVNRLERRVQFTLLSFSPSFRQVVYLFIYFSSLFISKKGINVEKNRLIDQQPG